MANVLANEPYPKSILCKWGLTIISLLYEDPLSFSELAKRLQISNKVLSEKIKALSRSGLIYSVDGIKRLYCLTEKGREVAEIVKPAVSVGITPLELHEVLSCKWMPQILSSLLTGDLFAVELAEKVPGISWKVLSQRLRKLQVFQMVRREVIGSHPVRVRYSLDVKGRLMVKWMLTNATALRGVVS